MAVCRAAAWRKLPLTMEVLGKVDRRPGATTHVHMAQSDYLRSFLSPKAEPTLPSPTPKAEPVPCPTDVNLYQFMRYHTVGFATVENTKVTTDINCTKQALRVDRYRSHLTSIAICMHTHHTLNPPQPRPPSRTLEVPGPSIPAFLCPSPPSFPETPSPLVAASFHALFVPLTRPLRAPDRPSSWAPFPDTNLSPTAAPISQQLRKAPSCGATRCVARTE